MKLRVTLLRSADAGQDVVITADAAASVGDVAAAILRADPQRAAQGAPTEARAVTLEAFSTVTAGSGEILDHESAIAHAGLANGAAVRVVTVGSERRPDVGLLQVTGGSDVGRTVPLTRGSFTIGRDDTCDIVLTDPLVSKRHARLEVGADRIELIDLNSANGILVGGSPVARLEAQRGRLEALLGDSRLVVTLQAQAVPASSGRAASVHQVEFIRSPRVEERYSGMELEGTDLPRPARKSPFPWLALVAPLLLGVGLYIFTRQPMTLLFVALSPILMIGTWVTTRTQNRREEEEQRRTFDQQLARLQRRLEEEREREIRVRRAEIPSLADVCADAVSAGPLIWTRRPEHWASLHVQLGSGESASRNTVAPSAHRDTALVPFVDKLDALVEEFAMVADVPILESLPLAGALGVAGARDRTGTYVRALLAQLTGLHAPGDLAVVAIAGASWSRELADLKWLPHAWEAQQILDVTGVADDPAAVARVVAQLEELIADRGADPRSPVRLRALNEDDAATRAGAKVGEDDQNPTAAPHPGVIVVIAPDAPADIGRLIQLSEDAAGRGVFPIWLADDIAALPAVCRTSVQVDADAAATVRFVRLGTTVTGVRTDALSTEQFGVFARALARLTDAGRVERDVSDVPRTVSLLQLIGRDMATSAESVVDRWLQNESIPSRLPAGRGARSVSKLRALVGQGGEGALHLDLRAQGPHALVGGTTGSGKSEFLQAWVLGMAAEYSPQRVTFLFVDYKGGSAFADCISLPHCVGIVTDLNTHLVRRVLVSLRAELHHRERLFNRRKVKDILELEKRGDPHAPPALVIVIDEFAALAKEVPEFVDGVVDIAQRGRSLGIHLIMATQRPAGVIKDNLRANTNLRVALRMADETDSDDVIGAKDAALFDPGLPGRGIAKTGPGRMSVFQSAYTGGWSFAAPDAPRVEIAAFGGDTAAWDDLDAAPGAAEESEAVDPGPNDQQLLIARMGEASALADLPTPRRPWLDELAPMFDQTKLQQRTDTQLVLGVLDIPERQEQVPFFFSPDDEGHIAFFGTGGSGKSAALRTLAVSAGITPRGGPVHVYGVDFSSGGLKMLEPLPHVGSVIPGDDIERVARLFATLKDELDRRGDAYALVNAGSITEYRTLAGRPDEPRILVLIDGFANLRQEYEAVAGRAETYRTLQQILSDGRSLGIHVALSADRAQTVPSALHAMIQRRVTLRMADADAYGLLDVPRDILDANSVPGRAIFDRHEAQLAVIGGTRSTKEQSIAIERMAASMLRSGRAEAPAIRALPVLYSAADLPATIGDRVAIGISDVDLGPYGIEPVGTFLVAGPPGSGRTNAVAAIAGQVLRAKPGVSLFYLGNARSSAASAVSWTDVATDSAKGMTLISRVIELMDAGESPVLVLEGIAEYSSSLLELRLTELIQRAGRGEALVIAEGELSEWTSNFGLLGDIKAARRGVILQPDTVDGELVLRTPFPRLGRGEFPVGRGILAQRGRIARVHFPAVLTAEGALHG
ncbi:MAG: FtsK/SpoIIIE domain-containing protein [Microbacterium sp.]